MSTYLLSAWWHGFFVGYYMMFMTGALSTQAGRTVRTSREFGLFSKISLMSETQ